MSERHLFTSESVSEGHPDKIADQISDAILDALLKKDPNARVAAETTVTTGLVVVVGEISTSAYIDIQKVVRDTIKGIGYVGGKFGFDGDNCAVLTAIDEWALILHLKPKTVRSIRWIRSVPEIKA